MGKKEANWKTLLTIRFQLEDVPEEVKLCSKKSVVAPGLGGKKKE